jgi:hypothetical protein
MKNISGDRIFCVVLTVLMLSVIFISAGSAGIRVKEGDWAKYLIIADVPEEMAGGYEEYVGLDWIKVEVESVSDTSVTVKTTIHYTNGIEETETMPGTGFVIDTALSEGDEVTSPMFTTGTPLPITGTKQRTYAGTSRQVFYVEFDMEQMGMSMDVEACWDKATGILCEMAMSMSGAIMEQTIDMSVSYKLTETNLWTGGLLSGQESLILVLGIIGVVGAVAGLAILLMLRRRAPIPEI